MTLGFGAKRDFKPTQAAVALAGVAVVAAAIAWTLPKGIAAGNPVEPLRYARYAPTTQIYRSDEPAAKQPVERSAISSDEPGRASGKAVCAECGIIESVQRIETPLKFTGWCDAAEIARTQNSGKGFGRDFRADRESLRETVAVAIAATHNSTKDAVTARHRIVVRLRNGSRQVFEETAPRLVRVGDRMVVIAGAPHNG